MFESYDREVRVACSPTWQPKENRVLGKFNDSHNQYGGNAANAIYQANNFGKLD